MALPPVPRAAPLVAQIQHRARPVLADRRGAAPPPPALNRRPSRSRGAARTGCSSGVGVSDVPEVPVEEPQRRCDGPPRVAQGMTPPVDDELVRDAGPCQSPGCLAG